MDHVTGRTTLHPGARGAQAHLIKAGRLQLGMTQKELAQRLGVHEQTIAHIESGRRLATGSVLIEKMADLFGYTKDQLYSAAHRLAPDMKAYIENNPALMAQIKVLMDRQTISQQN